MDRKLAEYNLKKAFGFDQFYDEQWEAISKRFSFRGSLPELGE